MPRFLPVGKGVKGAAGFLLAAIPALGAVLTGLAVTGDLVGRMARDHPLASYAAFGFAALAVFAGAAAAFALRDGSREEAAAIYAGLALVGASLLVGVFAGVQTWGDRVQPSITLTPKPGDRIAVSVRGAGLRSSDHILVEVEQLLRGETGGRLTWKPGQPLYGASLGPDGDGKIDQTVDIPLPAGDYDDLGARAWVGEQPQDCYAHGNTTGCVRVHVPRPQERPQLAVDWETFVRAPRLLIRLSAKNLPERPATEDEVRDASLQYVRKISGFTKPSQANEEAFVRAVDEIAAATRRLVDALVTTAEPKDREVEAARAKARAAKRYVAA